MPDFDDQVFLSDEITLVVSEFRKKHDAVFSIASYANEVAHKLIFGTSVKRSDVQQLLVACLLQRAMSSYQSVVILAERGLSSESRVLLRTLLEVMFRLVAIAKDPEVGRAYILEDEVHRKKLINKFKLLSDPVKATVGHLALDSLLTIVQKKIEDDDIRERKTQWFAERADLADFYHSPYSVFSGSVHVNVRDLETALEVDANGDVTGFNYGPNDQGLVSSIATAIEALLLSLEAAFSLLPTLFPNLLKELRGRFEAFYAALPVHRSL